MGAELTAVPSETAEQIVLHNNVVKKAESTLCAVNVVALAAHTMMTMDPTPWICRWAAHKTLQVLREAQKMSLPKLAVASHTQLYPGELLVEHTIQ